MNYRNAMKPKTGWRYAEDESLLALAATTLANKHCLQPEAVYEWAKKFCPDLYDRFLYEEGRALYPPDTRILTSVLNGLPLSDESEFVYGKNE